MRQRVLIHQRRQLRTVRRRRAGKDKARRRQDQIPQRQAAHAPPAQAVGQQAQEVKRTRPGAVVEGKVAGRQPRDTVVLQDQTRGPNLDAGQKAAFTDMGHLSWLTYRAHRLRPGSSASIPWADLQKQFGSAYREQSDFKIAFESALKQVQWVYPARRCAARDAYFVLN